MDRRLRLHLHETHRDTIGVTRHSPRQAIDVTLFASPVVTVGRWRCPADHPHFHDSGPASSHLFVFPRERVWIRHEGARPTGAFVADANTVTYYNHGQRYTRAHASARGDRGDWFTVAPDVLCDVLATYDPAARDRPAQPFPFSHGPSDMHSYWRQRRVWLHVSNTPTCDQLYVEEEVLAVLSDVVRLAYQARHGGGESTAPLPAATIDVVEAARDVMASAFAENLSLSDIGARVGVSMFHLARAFRRRTGFTLHGYRTNLRLRASLERVTDTDQDLSQMALDLGFSSHSHFTAMFRRGFGMTPSAVRRRGLRRD